MHSDIDECSDGTDNYSQICTNTEGGFNCGCNDGAICNGMDTNMSIYDDWHSENQSYLSAICFTKCRLDLVLVFLIPILVWFLYKIINSKCSNVSVLT